MINNFYIMIVFIDWYELPTCIFTGKLPVSITDLIAGITSFASAFGTSNSIESYVYNIMHVSRSCNMV